VIGWAITAGYVAVMLLTARCVSHRFRESEKITREDTTDQLFAAFIGLTFGLLWPATLTFLALSGLINGRPTTEDRQEEIRAKEDALRERERELALKEQAVRDWQPGERGHRDAPE
jgi:hypothetical protein